MERLNEQQAAKLASLSVKQQTSASDIQRIALELHLRQWCVEQANVFCEHNGPVEGQGLVGYALDKVAEGIYTFVTTPLREQQ